MKNREGQATTLPLPLGVHNKLPHAASPSRASSSNFNPAGELIEDDGFVTVYPKKENEE